MLIAKVVTNSLATQSGLKPSDVIQSVNGQTVTQPEAIQTIVEATPVGRTLQIGVNRQGQTLTLPVQTASLPAQTEP